MRDPEERHRYYGLVEIIYALVTIGHKNIDQRLRRLSEKPGFSKLFLNVDPGINENCGISNPSLERLDFRLPVFDSCLGQLTFLE